MLFLNNLLDKVSTSNSSINSFLSDLKNYLENSKPTYYTVDRIEECFAVCENMKTSKMENILLSTLPNNVKEGTVLKFQNFTYSIDNEFKKKRENDLRDKVNKVWKS